MTEWSMSFLELISFSVNRNVDVLEGNFHVWGMRPGHALDANDGRGSRSLPISTGLLIRLGL